MHSILLFLKAPRPGLIKTRLAATIGNADAQKIYCQLVERQVSALTVREQTTVHYSPPDACDEMRCWLGSDLKFVPQSDGDLGARLRYGVERAFSGGAQRVICIGGDCPALEKKQIDAAFAVLDTVDVVFGPTDDGGYYLVGLNQLRSELFQDIPWSSEDTLRASIEKAESQGLRYTLLEPLYDVDDATTLQRAVADGWITGI